MKTPSVNGVPLTAQKNNRLQWSQLPEHVRIGIEDILGSPVLTALSQPGGYSPGTADRIVTENGAKFFVKAVGTPINADSPKIHRKEIRIMESIADHLDSSLLGSYDDGEWVAIVFKDIAGRHPNLSKKADHVLVMDALRKLTSSPLSEEAIELLPSLSDDVAYAFNAWQRIKDAPIEGLDLWIEENFERLELLSITASERLLGNFLVHTDLRKDNILLTKDEAYIVDWPWAAAGAPWFDALTVSIDATVYGPEFDFEEALLKNDLFAGCSQEDIDAVLAGMMGYFFDSARKPAPEGIVSLRQFQYDEGLACLRILKNRWN